ncbi:unnamed protein product [Gongylonema pulchrum]|uniref:Uncharacterized protein n=1 Tax=Gongylonema pulchrum TaxID=637853 RepID=A0A3P7MWP6_9BILA|nr:unnamed protein product [Gongylonema pulchrum]
MADKRLLENAQQVKIIEEQIEYTHRLLENKRILVGRWQNDVMQKVHKEDLLVLEQENLDMERKMVDWCKENQRLLGIFQAMKDREVEMIFAAERCLQRNRRARVCALSGIR